MQLSLINRPEGPLVSVPWVRGLRRAAIAVCLLARAGAAWADDKVDTTVTFFSERRGGDDSLTVVHPQFDVGVDLGPSFSLEAGYHVSDALSVVFSVLNALDRRDNDIEYFYTSRLAGEPAPVADYHFHPIEPRLVRVAVTLRLR